MDEPRCLNYSSTESCKTIAYPVNRGFSMICLHGTFQNISNSIELLSDYEISNEVNIICQECVIENSKFSLSCRYAETCRITLNNLTMRQCNLQLGNVHAHFKNMTLEDVFIKDTSNINKVGSNQINFENAAFYCLGSDTFESVCGIQINNKNTLKIQLTKSQFFGFRIDVSVSQLMLTFHEVMFSKPMIDVHVISNEYLRIPAIVRFEKVTVVSHNTDQSNSTNSLRIKSKIHFKSYNPFMRFNLVNPHVVLRECYFSECNLEINSFRLRFEPVHFSLLISNSIFRKSYHEGNGGGLSIRSEVQHSKIMIFSCNFSNNIATKGLTNSKGSGGGLYVEAYSLHLNMEGCIFDNNGASDSGLALYTSEGVTSSLVNCSFLYDLMSDELTKKTGMQALIFAAGRISKLNVYFHIVNKSPEIQAGPIAVLYIGQAHQILTEVQCPNFYQHVTQFTSKSTATRSILDLRHECSPCSDNYYVKSLEKHILSHNPNENTSVLNDLIKKTESKSCVQCTYGGLCTGNNVIPRPNYWGFWYETELIFKQCPAGYCCSGGEKSFCTKYDYCAGNRTGILCGACLQGFSVSIFNGFCLPNSQCGGDKWFWLFAIFSAITYVLWYTLKEDVFSSVIKILTGSKSFAMCRSLKSTENKVQLQLDSSLASSKKPVTMVKISSTDVDKKSIPSLTLRANDKTSLNKGYFGIVTYFIQMAAVMKIEIEFSDIDKSVSFLDKLLENFGQFLNVELTKVSFDVCPITGLTMLGKHFYSLFAIFGIYLGWAVIFSLTDLILKSVPTSAVTLNGVLQKAMAFKQKLIGGLVEIVKYTYAGFCGIIFRSLVCIKIGSTYVWWYEASNICFEKWQVLIVMFAVVYAIPFPLVLIYGLKLLRQNKISTTVFLCCCLCPMLSLGIILKLKWFKQNGGVSENLTLSPSSEVVISILQGPYRNDDASMALYWEAMVSIRRLLITGMTLIGYASIRMIIITILSLVFLVQHNYMSPFQVPTSNDVEALSLVLLCLTSVSNLLKASLTDSGVVPSGPTVQFFKSLELCEKMLVMTIVAYVMMIELRLKKKK